MRSPECFMVGGHATASRCSTTLEWRYALLIRPGLLHRYSNPRHRDAGRLRIPLNNPHALRDSALSTAPQGVQRIRQIPWAP